jgi:Protein of unknown function (DUF1153)
MRRVGHIGSSDQRPNTALRDSRVGMSSITAALPLPNTKRWVASRKAAVVMAVCSGEISLEEACRRYQLSEEEFCAWEHAFKTYGLLGLRATCVHQFRGSRLSQSVRAASSTATITQRGVDSRAGEQTEG